jgi:hypothetical protein
LLSFVHDKIAPSYLIIFLKNMMKRTSLPVTLALVAQALFQHPVQAGSLPARDALSIPDANACIAKLDAAGKPESGLLRGNMHCFKPKDNSSCSVDAANYNLPVVDDTPTGRRNEPQLIMGDTLQLQFVSQSGNLVDVTTDYRGNVTDFDVIGPAAMIIRTGKSINLSDIAALSPQDRQVIDTWIHYGLSSPCKLVIG